MRQFPNIPTTREGALGALEAELGGERAAALGRLGGAVEKALDALRTAQPAADRSLLVDDAAQAVWRYFVQREAMGLFDQKQPIADFQIPREVLRRVGAT